MGNMYYKNVYLYSSLQTSNNLEKYFLNHTEKLLVFVLNPRLQNRDNVLRLYKKGTLVEERKIVLSENIFLYYLLWHLHHVYFLLSYFRKKEKVYVMSIHPVTLFGLTLQRMLRNIRIFYWDGDYFPPVNLSLILYEKLKKFYLKRVDYAYYQGDIINKIINGKVLHTPFRKTVMLGILPRNIKRKYIKNKFNILFVGVIKRGQGLEFLFEFLEKHKEYSIKILGISSEDLYKIYLHEVKERKIEKQVYFPNRFFSDEELEEISKECQVGIAVYDMDKNNCTYYTDPGKIKTYASLGLPIVMTDVSAIAPYIKRFGCGEVIQKNSEELGNALIAIKKNYKKYLVGLEKFTKYFYFETYYHNEFTFVG